MFRKLFSLLITAVMLLCVCGLAVSESGSSAAPSAAGSGSAEQKDAAASDTAAQATEKPKAGTVSIAKDPDKLRADLKEGFDGHKYYGGYDDMMDATIAIFQRSGQGNAKDIWWWEFCRQYFGINFKVTQLTDVGNYKSVAFMSGDMPDVFYQLFLDTATLVEQGQSNGNLIELDGYIKPEIMPNLSRIYAAHPEMKMQITAQDGHIYGLGCIQDADNAQMTYYINKRWLDDAGLELPKTLDEFKVMLQKFKERQNLPENKDKTVVPVDGDFGVGPCFIANAFGWITDNAAYMTHIALKDGEPIFIYADEERFPAFMKTIKEYLDAGYFSPEFFNSQIAGNQSMALKASDLTGVSLNTTNAINPDEWIVARPLTSEFNPKPQISRSFNALNCASFSISSSCDPNKVERLMKWVDWLYKNDNYIMSHNGPSVEETEYLYTGTDGGLKSGYTMTWDDGLDAYRLSSAEVEDGTYGSFGEYQYSKVQGIITGYLGLNMDMFNDKQRTTNPMVYTKGEDVNVLPFLVDCYPNMRFFDAKTSARITELATDINSFVQAEYTAFVSGEKEINEENLKTYFDTLKNTYNYEEYIGYFKDYYEKYKASLQASTAAAPAEADKPAEAAPAEADKPAA